MRSIGGAGTGAVVPGGAPPSDDRPPLSRTND
jgi:hypothetical protein